MKITLNEHKGSYDGSTCYVHSRAAALGEDSLLITTQRLNVSGCDDFSGPEVIFATQGGKVISPPMPDLAFGRKALCEGVEFVECDATPMRLRKSNRILLIGHYAFYRDGGNAAASGYQNRGFYTFFDEENGVFLPTRAFEVDVPADVIHCAPGSVQFYEKEDGELLIPFTLKRQGGLYEVCLFHFRLCGDHLTECGKSNRLSYPIARGAYEPSVIFARGKYILTVRNDTVGLYSTSTDGYLFGELMPWCFDDGSLLENYNTQQHFLSLGTRVYLVYTRRGADNDHVFRHRAPLFLSEIDTERMCLIRSTERIAVPERGARLGHFGVTNVSDDLAYLTVSEWMQPIGCEKHGSDNTLFIVKFENN